MNARILVALMLLSLSSSAIAAEPVDARLGVRATGVYSVLMAPNDPQGEPTLLSGAGFKGLGGGAGVSGTLFLSDLSAGRLFLSLDLLFVAHTATGKAEAPATEQIREVTLDNRTLHVPAQIGLLSGKGANSFRIAIGPELLLGMGSGATVDQTNIPEPPQPLYTTPVTHVGLAATVGMDLNWPEWVLPIDVRIVWDPSVPNATRERFDNYVSNDEPGNFQVAHDVQIFVSVGIDRVLKLSK